jgi:hypothetical protein
MVMASVGEVPGDSEPVDINQRSTAAEYPHTSYILALAEGLELAKSRLQRESQITAAFGVTSDVNGTKSDMKIDV